MDGANSFSLWTNTNFRQWIRRILLWVSQLAGNLAYQQLIIAESVPRNSLASGMPDHKVQSKLRHKEHNIEKSLLENEWNWARLFSLVHRRKHLSDSARKHNFVLRSTDSARKNKVLQRDFGLHWENQRQLRGRYHLFSFALEPQNHLRRADGPAQLSPETPEC